MALIHPEAVKLKIDLDKAYPESGLAISMIVNTFSAWLTATKEIDKSGLVVDVTTTNGSIRKRPNPLIKIALDYQVQLLKLLQEFGLSPASAKKLKTEVVQDNPFVEMLKKLNEKNVETR